MTDERTPYVQNRGAAMMNLTPGTRVKIRNSGTGVVVAVEGKRYAVKLDGGAPWKSLKYPLVERSELVVEGLR